jgi:small-conductance mechanosensitive channel
VKAPEPKLGEFVINWEQLIVIGSIVLVAIVANRVSRWLLARSFKQASEKLKVDPTRYRFFRNAITLIIWLIAGFAIIYSIPAWRTFAITMFAGAGVLLAVIGFAGQSAFSNIISGVFIVIFRPFRVGDLIKIDENHTGNVIDITLRHVVLKDFTDRRIIVPNSVIHAATIVNYDIYDSRHCQFVEFNVALDTDIDQAMQIMREEAEKHPLLIDMRTTREVVEEVPKVKTKLISFGESSMKLRAWCWTTNFDDAAELQWDLNRTIKMRFDKAGIVIPYPHRTIVYKDKKP